MDFVTKFGLMWGWLSRCILRDRQMRLIARGRGKSYSSTGTAILLVQHTAHVRHIQLYTRYASHCIYIQVYIYIYILYIHTILIQSGGGSYTQIIFLFLLRFELSHYVFGWLGAPTTLQRQSKTLPELLQPQQTLPRGVAMHADRAMICPKRKICGRGDCDGVPGDWRFSIRWALRYLSPPLSVCVMFSVSGSLCPSTAVVLSPPLCLSVSSEEKNQARASFDLLFTVVRIIPDSHFSCPR